MSKFDLVTSVFDEVRYMRAAQAEVIRELIRGSGARDILEIGFYQGKSSAYIAAVLEDLGEGTLTTLDMASAARHEPSIEQILGKLELDHRVVTVFCKRSYTWELQRLISAPNGPKFDFCYFDGGHTWDSTGFGVLLVDMLLRPGGLLLLDDLNWSMSRSRHYAAKPQLKKKYDDDEVEAEPVRLVWDTILPHLGYEHIREYPAHRWAVARKPAL